MSAVWVAFFCGMVVGAAVMTVVLGLCAGEAAVAMCKQCVAGEINQQPQGLRYCKDCDMFVDCLRKGFTVDGVLIDGVRMDVHACKTVQKKQQAGGR